MAALKPELKEALIKLMSLLHSVEIRRPFGKDKISLDVLQYKLLMKITRESCSIKDLEKSSKLKRNIVSSNISFLEKTGLIAKDVGSGREVKLYLTESGEEMMAAVDDQFEDLFSFANETYSIKEERLLIDFLSRFSAGLEDLLNK